MIKTHFGHVYEWQANSAYYLEYASKKREYFAADGRLLASCIGMAIN